MAQDDRHHRQMREAVERQRFGYTRAEILAAKGNKCAICGQPVPNNEDMVIDHINGGGRHHTERGMMAQGTHDMDNLQIAHRECAGRKDRLRDSMGLGIAGNTNNPSQ